MRKSLTQLLFTFMVIGSCVAGYFHFSPFWQPFEYKIKDLMLQSRGEIMGDDNIVIVDIDEKSLKTLGQWPWSRDKVAKLLQNLSDFGAAIIGLDVVFAEADNSSPQHILKQFRLPYENLPDYDAILAQTITQTPTVMGYVFALTPDFIEPEGHPKSAAIIIEHERPAHSSLIKPYRAILNIPLIQQKAYSSGYFNTIPDNDGIVRSIPLVMEYDGVLYPSLSLEMIRIALGEKKINIVYDERGVSQIEIGEHIIPTDFYGRLMVNYRGSQHSYEYISAVDVYNNHINPRQVKDKIVLIGTSAAGLLDLRSTPFESVYAGVEVHANAIDNILHQDYIAKPIWTVGVDIISLFVVCFITLAILLLPSALFSFIALVVLNLCIIFIHYYSMIYQGVLFNTILPLVAINILFIIGQAINYFLEIRQKELVKHKFASKVSPAVMNNILSSNNDVLEGVEKEITIFFSDIRNFTALSEAAGAPKHLIHLMNAYMDPMSQIIIRAGGTVDKFIGDAINLGSRLESLCKYYNSHLTISNFTKSLLKGSYIFRFLDLVTVKGKSEPVEVWQIHDFDTPQKEPLYNVSYEELHEELTLHHEAIALYKEARFSEALSYFEALQKRENKTNEAIYTIYCERCSHYIAFPPASFNGVFVHTTKG